MHKELLVVSIMSGGKILRELGDTVLLPFGAEYSVYVKNLSTQRCEFKIFIDGKNIAGNDSFIINGNSSMTIERFLDGNQEKGYKFKFIERTKSIEKHRGIEAEDGLIRVEYEFERQVMPITNTWRPAPLDWPKDDPYRFNTALYAATNNTSDSLTRRISVSTFAAGSTVQVQNCTAFSDSTTPTTAQANDIGITTHGDISTQKFVTVNGISGTGIKNTIVLKLKGEIQSHKVSKPLTTKMKLECNMCGKLNKGYAKYCMECGTNLQLL